MRCGGAWGSPAASGSGRDGVDVAEVATQFAGGVGLGKEFLGLGRGACDGVGAEEEAQRRLVLFGDDQQGVRELGGAAGLPAVDALPGFIGLPAGSA